MTQQLSGVPKAVANVVDSSLVFNRDSISNICVQGVTKRGKVGKPVYVRNSTEFTREFGGDVDGSDFPLYCRRILDAGGKLWVSRAGHYTDVADKTTLSGTKGAVTVGTLTTAETLAQATVVVTNAGTNVNTFTIEHDGNTLATYDVETSDTILDVVTGLLASFANNTDGYTLVSSNSTSIVIKAPVGTGATVNTDALEINVAGGGAGAGTDGTFAGGVTAVGEAINFIAEEVGSGYNGTVIQVVNASSGASGKYDIKVTAKDSDTTQTYKDFPTSATSGQIATFNSKMKYVQIVSVLSNPSVGTGSIAGGIQDISLILPTDYNGSKVGQTGWWSFGNVTNAMRIANISISDPVVDLGLASYVADRGDMRFHIASPINATPETVKDYRLGEGIYTHQAIDDWRGSLIAGQVNITDENDSQRTFNIPALVDYLGLRAKVDTEFGAWITATGSIRGKVTMPNNGVDEVNFISPAYSDIADECFTEGVMAIVDDETYGTVAWGNKSLLRDRSKLLNAENVADLAMFLKRSLEPIAKKYISEPNDPSTWRKLYREVLPFIASLETGRAIVGGEGTGWFWVGDQDAVTSLQATFNTQEDITAGIYKVRFVFIPIRAIDYINIDVTITDGNAIVSVVENTL